MQTSSVLWETVRRYLRTLNISEHLKWMDLSLDWVILLLQKQLFERKLALPCSLQHYLQLPNYEKKPTCPRTDEWSRKHVYTQWNTTQWSKKYTHAIYSNINEAWKDNAKGNKERNTDVTNVWKNVTKLLYWCGYPKVKFSYKRMNKY